MRKFVAVLLLLLTVSGCSLLQPEPVHVAFGKILNVQSRMATQLQPNLAGAAVGGIAGGVAGNQFGKGNGKTAMTLLGAATGALVGSQVNMRETVSEVTDLTVQLNDGGAIAITTQPMGFRVGQHVRITQQGKKASIEAVP